MWPGSSDVCCGLSTCSLPSGPASPKNFPRIPLVALNSVSFESDPIDSKITFYFLQIPIPRIDGLGIHLLCWYIGLQYITTIKKGILGL